MSGYPKDMVHPAYAPAVLGRMAGEGRPARFPPVTVNTPDQEEEYRARGYMLPGEAPVSVGYAEYPKMLFHPDNIPAVEDEIIAKREPNGEITRTVIRGKPEHLPPITVADPDEEAEWLAKGYAPRSKGDPEAVTRAAASPYVAGRVYEEWPKMIDGKIVDMRPVVDTTNYPKWIADGQKDKDGNPTGVIVNSAEEERALTGKAPEVPPPPPVMVSVDATEHQRLLEELAALRAKDAARERMANARAARKPRNTDAA